MCRRHVFARYMKYVVFATSQFPPASAPSAREQLNRLFLTASCTLSVARGVDGQRAKRYSPARLCRSVPSGLAKERGQKKSYPQGMMKRTGLLPHSDRNRHHQVLLLTFRHDARTQEPVTSVPVRNRYSIGPTFPSPGPQGVGTTAMKPRDSHGAKAFVVMAI